MLGSKFLFPNIPTHQFHFMRRCSQQEIHKLRINHKKSTGFQVRLPVVLNINCNIKYNIYIYIYMSQTQLCILFNYITLWYIMRPRRRWVDNIRMDLQEVGCGYMDWIGLVQDRDSWRKLVSAVMNLWVPWNAGSFLTSCKPVSFSRRTLHLGVSNTTLRFQRHVSAQFRLICRHLSTDQLEDGLTNWAKTCRWNHNLI